MSFTCQNCSTKTIVRETRRKPTVILRDHICPKCALKFETTQVTTAQFQAIAAKAKLSPEESDAVRAELINSAPSPAAPSVDEDDDPYDDGYAEFMAQQQEGNPKVTHESNTKVTSQSDEEYQRELDRKFEAMAALLNGTNKTEH